MFSLPPSLPLAASGRAPGVQTSPAWLLGRQVAPGDSPKSGSSVLSLDMRKGGSESQSGPEKFSWAFLEESVIWELRVSAIVWTHCRNRAASLQPANTSHSGDIISPNNAHTGVESNRQSSGFTVLNCEISHRDRRSPGPKLDVWNCELTSW